MIASKGRGNAGYLDSAMLEILQTGWDEKVVGVGIGAVI